MRVASMVLVLTHAVYADTVLPDRETELQANQVRVFARLGQCDRALEAGKEVAERDAAYYRQVVATDAGLFACHYELEAGRRYRSWRDRQPRSYTHRIGVDTMASFGPILTLGGWLRYERASGLVLRAGYVAGQIMESEDDGFDAVAAHVGYRAYYGSFYLHAEAGGVVVRERAFFDYLEDEWRPACGTCCRARSQGSAARPAAPISESLCCSLPSASARTWASTSRGCRQPSFARSSGA